MISDKELEREDTFAFIWEAEYLFKQKRGETSVDRKLPDVTPFFGMETDRMLLTWYA